MNPENARIERDGFEVLPRFIDEATLTALRAGYDQLLEGGAAGDRMLGNVTRQIMLPENALELFQENPALEAGRAFARERLGWAEPARTFSMLIYKPPGHPHETPWHQDIAYLRQPVTPAGLPVRRLTLQFWVALDDADASNGCMHFIPEDLGECLPHHVASGDPADEGRLLAVDQLEAKLAATEVACPISAGSATVHHEGTLHRTTPNGSERRRRAYIFNLADRG